MCRKMLGSHEGRSRHTRSGRSTAYGGRSCASSRTSSASSSAVSLHGGLHKKPPAGGYTPVSVQAVRDIGATSDVRSRLLTKTLRSETDSRYSGGYCGASTASASRTSYPSYQSSELSSARSSRSSGSDTLPAGGSSAQINRSRLHRQVNPHRQASASWLNSMAFDAEHPDMRFEVNPRSGRLDPAAVAFRRGHDGCAGVPSQSTTKLVYHLCDYKDRTPGDGSSRFAVSRAPLVMFGVDKCDRKNRDYRAPYDKPTDPLSGKFADEPDYRPMRRTNYRGKGLHAHCWKVSSTSELPTHSLSHKEREKIKYSKSLTNARGEFQPTLGLGGEDLKPAGTQPCFRTDQLPSDELLRHNDYQKFPHMPLAPAGSRAFTKADLPPSPQLIRYNAKRVLGLYDRGGTKSPNPQMFESPDMFYCLWGATEQPPHDVDAAEAPSLGCAWASSIDRAWSTSSARERHRSAPPSLCGDWPAASARSSSRRDAAARSSSAKGGSRAEAPSAVPGSHCGSSDGVVSSWRSAQTPRRYQRSRTAPGEVVEPLPT